MTVACLNAVGNLSPVKERLAMCAIISEKKVLQAIKREVGIISIVDDLAGEELRTRLTSSAVTAWGQPVGPRWSGKDRSVCTDQTPDMSLTDSRSLTILSTKLRANVQQRLWFSSSVLVLSVSLECSSSLTIFQRCVRSEPASWIR